jgi:hemerythrin
LARSISNAEGIVDTMDTYLRLSRGLTVGIQAIDKQHVRFFEIIDDVSELLATRGVGPILLSPVLTDIYSYMNYHFTTEHVFMRSIGYPEYEEHKKQHDVLAEGMDELVCRLDEGTADLEELLFLLKGWVTGHIADADRRLGDYYREVRDRNGMNITSQAPEAKSAV